MNLHNKILNWTLTIVSIAVWAYLVTTEMVNKRKDIAALQSEVAMLNQRQLDLITYNDCFTCHPQERRCEPINGRVWCWEIR